MMKGSLHYHHPRRLGAVQPWTMRSLPTGERREPSSALASHTPAASAETPVEGLQMAHAFHHDPVMLARVLELFAEVPSGIIVDGTLGGAGHSAALLADRSDIQIIGIDRDEIARAAATEHLRPFGDRATILAGTFSDLAKLVDGPVVGVLLDLGVSSPQLDDPSRGFSFRGDAPLDMRMDRSQGFTAADFIANATPGELADLFRAHGEGRLSMTIARRVKQDLPATTGALVDAVDAAVPPAARRRGHVATRVFQALRVVVNGEEQQLFGALQAAEEVLGQNGRLVVISYHSGEDRAVKSFLRDGATGGCTCPVNLGCVCGATPRWAVTRQSAELASDDEISRNPRARSARLRWAERTLP
jgi:16S rRNA (cytosine1402-N4)-methyltransferase